MSDKRRPVLTYDPACRDCRRDAGKDAAGATWQCGPHVAVERDDLRSKLAEREAEVDILVQRVHERDAALGRLKRSEKAERGFTNDYIKRLHEAEAALAAERKECMAIRNERDEARRLRQEEYEIATVRLQQALDAATTLARERDELRQEKATDAWYTGWQEAVRRMQQAERERDELRALLQDTVPKLIPVVRMPNIEYSADAHNAARDRLRGALDAMLGGRDE